MNLVVIDRENSWHVADLRRAAESKHSIIAVGYDTVAATVFDGVQRSKFEVGGIDVKKIDCIFPRAMPASSLEQVVFRMDCLLQIQLQTETLVVNPAKTIEASVDKYLSIELLRRDGVPVPGTFVSQNAKTALQHFEHLNGDAVVKPLFGSGGRRIVRLRDRQSAMTHFETAAAAQEIIYQQEYIEHGDNDLRLLTICLLYTSPSPRDRQKSRMPSSA